MGGGGSFLKHENEKKTLTNMPLLESLRYGFGKGGGRSKLQVAFDFESRESYLIRILASQDWTPKSTSE